MNPEIAIRRMAANDLDRVLALSQELPSAPVWPRSAWLNAIDPNSTPRRIALVAEDRQSGSIRGFAVASLLPPHAELESIAVAPDCQRLGVGRKLLQELAIELQAAGACELVLEVRSSNQPALAFYRSLGFAQTGSRPAYYADPIEDAALMRLPLPSDPR